MPITSQAINRLRRYEIVAMKVEATALHRKGWVGVYPINSARRAPWRKYPENVDPSKDEIIFRIRQFEISDQLLAQDIYYNEDHLEACQDYWVQGFEDLEKELSNRGLDPGELLPPWRVEYPL